MTNDKDKYNNVINVLTKASEYRKNQLKGSKDRWITVGVTTNTHSLLKTMSDFYGLSIAETLKIIIKSSFKEFTEENMESNNPVKIFKLPDHEKGGKNGNS